MSHYRFPGPVASCPVPPSFMALPSSPHPDLHDIETCFEVSDELIGDALRAPESLREPSPRQKVFALLDRMMDIARPRQGAARILSVLAQMSTCDWIDGYLEVRVTGDQRSVSIDLLVDDGIGLERLRPTLRLQVPYEELRKIAITRAASLAPMVVKGTVTETAFRLTTWNRSRSSTRPPSASESALPRPPAKRNPSIPPARARMVTVMGIAPPANKSRSIPPPRAPLGTLLGVAPEATPKAGRRSTRPATGGKR
jgi:hypothetical protein